VESWLHPWLPSNQLGVLNHLCTVPVYKLLFIREQTSAVAPLVVLASTVSYFRCNGSATVTSFCYLKCNDNITSYNKK
jgi:hypothetical protein